MSDGKPDERLVRLLATKVDEFNLQATGIHDVREFLTVDKDADGQLTAGIYGWTWGGTCWIESLWVRDDVRRSGVGSRLLSEAETEARRRGCRQMALDTHSFQAPGFYRRHGYRVVGEIPEYPAGHSFLQMHKPLT